METNPIKSERNNATDYQGRRIVSVGSDPSNDICVKGTYPFHVRISCGPENCWLEDLTQKEASSVQTFLAPTDNPTERIPLVTPRAATYEDVLFLGVQQFSLAILRPVTPDPSPIRREQATGATSARSTASNTIRVGADSANRIVIEAPSVNPFHAEFRMEREKCWVRDSGQGNGTFLVNRDDPTQTTSIRSDRWTELSFSDSVLLGTYHFPLSRLSDIKDITIEEGRQVNIGRTQDNDRVFNRLSVSSHHARLHFRKKRGVLIEDLASVGGTFVNAKRLAPHTRHPLRVGDRIKIASYDLSLEPGTENRLRVDFSGDIKLDVKNLSCEIAGRLMSKGAASSVTEVSPDAKRASMARRVGSAKAAKVVLRGSSGIVAERGLI